MLASTSAATAHAQVTQNDVAAQEMQRQQERERALRERMEHAPDVRPQRSAISEAEKIPTDETPCFPINEIRLDDPSGRFSWALGAADAPSDPATGGRCLGSMGISRIMARIQNAIVVRGYVTTRVLAETQDLTGGILTLKIIQGPSACLPLR